MYFIYITIFMSATNVISWNEYHINQFGAIDTGIPQINNRKECGISVRKCDPNSTFEDPFVSSRVYEGEFAQKGEFPWYAYLSAENFVLENGKKSLISVICGASFLNEWWALTAAHCVDQQNLFSVMLFGGSNRETYWHTLRYEVERVVIHPDYSHFHNRYQNISKEIDDKIKEFSDWELDGNNVSNYPNSEYEKYVNLTKMRTNLWFWEQNYDLALLKVRHKIVPIFNETHYIVNTICLPIYGIENYDNESLVIMGFGKVSKKGAPSKILKKGITIMMDFQTCETIASNTGFVTENICTQKVENANTSLTRAINAEGDSGSPAHQYFGCQAVQVGIVSHGTHNDKYGWYQRVSNFITWIRWSIHNRKPHWLRNTGLKSENFGETSNSWSYPLLLVLTNLCLIIAVILSLILFWVLAIIALSSINKPYV